MLALGALVGALRAHVRGHRRRLAPAGRPGSRGPARRRARRRWREPPLRRRPGAAAERLRGRRRARPAGAPAPTTRPPRSWPPRWSSATSAASSSHGVLRVGEYVAARSGAASSSPAARPRAALARRRRGRALDGGTGFGQLGARAARASATSSAGARAHGVALGTLAGVRHVGRLGEWVELAAAEGCMAPCLLQLRRAGRQRRPVRRLGRPARARTRWPTPIPAARPAAGGRRLLDLGGRRGQGAAVPAAPASRCPSGWLVDPDGGRPTTRRRSTTAARSCRWAATRATPWRCSSSSSAASSAGAGCASLGESPGNGVTAIVVDPAATPGGRGLRRAGRRGPGRGRRYRRRRATERAGAPASPSARPGAAPSAKASALGPALDGLAETGRSRSASSCTDTEDRMAYDIAGGGAASARRVAARARRSSGGRRYGAWCMLPARAVAEVLSGGGAATGSASTPSTA